MGVHKEIKSTMSRINRTEQSTGNSLSNRFNKYAATLTLAALGTTGVAACGGNANATGPEKPPVTTSQSGEVPTTPAQSGVETTSPTSLPTTPETKPTLSTKDMLPTTKSFEELRSMPIRELEKLPLGDRGRLFAPSMTPEALKNYKDLSQYSNHPDNFNIVLPSETNSDQNIADWNSYQITQATMQKSQNSEGGFTTNKDACLRIGLSFHDNTASENYQTYANFVRNAENINGSDNILGKVVGSSTQGTVTIDGHSYLTRTLSIDNVDGSHSDTTLALVTFEGPDGQPFQNWIEITGN